MFDRLKDAWRQEQERDRKRIDAARDVNRKRYRDRKRIDAVRNASMKRYMTDDEAYALNIAIEDWKQGRR